MRGSLYSTLLAVLAVTLGLMAGCASSPPKPSLVLVVMEGVRADHTSILGYPRQTTPGLEALQHEGVVFENAYASSPSTPASLASIITGRYPPEHGSFLKLGLDDAVVTLAEVLKQNGYETHAISSDTAYDESSGFFQGFDAVERIDPYDVDELDGGAAAVSAKAIAWLTGKRSGNKPFFLMLIYSSTQLPYDPPAGFRAKFQELDENPMRIQANSQFWTPFARRYNAGELQLSARDLRILTGLYDGEIAYVDHQITQVVSTLRDQAIIDDLLLVVTSEKGEVLGEVHKLADSTSLREASLRVPLLMRFPAKLTAGQKTTALIQDVDLLPSICDLLDVPVPASISRSAISQFPRSGTAKREHAISVALKSQDQGVVQLWMSIKDATHRYEISPAGPVSLYDLKSDATGNLNVLEERGEIAEKLHAALGQWSSSLTPLPGMGPSISPEQGAGAQPEPATPSASQ